MKSYDKQELRRRCTSVKAWELPKHPSAIAPDGVYTNPDMDPVPLEQQTWSVWTILAYWSSDLMNLSTLQTAGSILAVGLDWRAAIPIMLVGTTCIAVAMCLVGSVGSRLHIPFSVFATASFGYYFRYFAIVSRAVLAMFWLGVQCANGSFCVTIMLSAWAPSYARIPNALPESAGITSMGMCSFFLFWILQLPLLLIHPTKLRPLFYVKLIATPAVVLGTMGWAVRKAGGGGDLFRLQPEIQPGTSQYAWLWLSCMSSVTGQWATMGVNIPDFTRYAKSANSQFVQLPFVPLIFTLCGTLGIITTSATKVFAGEYLWNPLDIVSLWLSDGPGGRCAAFFAALAWFIATVGTNVTANSISAANDLTIMFPRYINIKRGSVVAAVIGGWVLVPWKILASAQTFLNFMGAYAVFLAPISGIMAADFWLVKKQRYDLPGEPPPPPPSPSVALRCLYIQWDGYPAVNISDGAQHLYSFDWLFGFVVSMFLYTGLSWLMPAKDTLMEETVWVREGMDIEGAAGSDVENPKIPEKVQASAADEQYPPNAKVL
ncbi:putative permease C1683.05-like protein 2 [Colletotrichum chlorophyti]|uniref:Putative permease C1683.05-like protein 2 n=1 Tax=Colletotrichum chlorophyti TaxID=708187 RepID=A0A1Q8S662_9PEZI|nr:putative permease C1683.05-like protein 2 [Colletotrichum chlorophyti]